MAVRNRSTGGPRRGGSLLSEPNGHLPDEPNGHSHNHGKVVQTDPGWYALFTWTTAGVALPVVAWRVSTTEEPDDAPHFLGVTPGGFGHWDFAEFLYGFVDYLYSPDGPPSTETIRQHFQIVAMQHAKQPEGWEPARAVRAWLKGEPTDMYDEGDR